MIVVCGVVIIIKLKQKRNMVNSEVQITILYVEELCYLGIIHNKLDHQYILADRVLNL